MLAQDVIHNKTAIYDYLALRNVVLRNFDRDLTSVGRIHALIQRGGAGAPDPPPLKNHNKYRVS